MRQQGEGTTGHECEGWELRTAYPGRGGGGQVPEWGGRGPRWLAKESEQLQILARD